MKLKVSKVTVERALIVERLNHYMKRKKMTNYRLWQLTDISQTTIGKILRGERSPSWYTIERFCEGLDITPEQLILEDDKFDKNAINLLNTYLSMTKQDKYRIWAFIKGLEYDSKYDLFTEQVKLRHAPRDEGKEELQAEKADENEKVEEDESPNEVED